MCGIAGVLHPTDAPLLVASLLHRLRHRGPDGELVVSGEGCALGVRRLAVRGAASDRNPIIEASRIVALNGEIYRFPQTGPVRGRVPTNPLEEVRAILASEAAGVRPEGMYAIAEFEGALGELRLQRDQFGMKPLFWRVHGDTLLFASETKALRMQTAPEAVDCSAIDDILAFGRPLGSRTPYRGIRPVPRGKSVVFFKRGEVISPAMTRPLLPAPSYPGGLRQAVRESLLACLQTNRAVGLAISGGIDSTILAWELNDLGVEALTTFSVHVEGAADGVRDLGNLGLPANGPWRRWRHVNVPVRADQLFELTNESVQAMDTPHRMTSAPLCIALARAVAKDEISVLLTGEGPDELFFGYESHRRFFQGITSRPRSRQTARLADLTNFALQGTGRHMLNLVLPNRRSEACVERFARRYRALAHGSPAAALGEVELDLSLEPLLARTDQCLMKYGIEGRMPFLHDAVPALAASVSERAAGQTVSKQQFREAWADCLPPQLLFKKKVAFRSPLRDWVAKGDGGWLRAYLVDARDELAKIGLNVDPLVTRAESTQKHVLMSFALCTTAMWLRSMSQQSASQLNHPTAS
ncbi:MAG: asparagine synthetase B [Hyphomicrobium sp.]